MNIEQPPLPKLSFKGGLWPELITNDCSGSLRIDTCTRGAWTLDPLDSDRSLIPRLSGCSRQSHRLPGRQSVASIIIENDGGCYFQPSRAYNSFLSSRVTRCHSVSLGVTPSLGGVATWRSCTRLWRSSLFRPKDWSSEEGMLKRCLLMGRKGKTHLVTQLRDRHLGGCFYEAKDWGQVEATPLRAL